MADANVVSIADMEHMDPLVETYEQTFGNHLQTKRSVNGKFRVYQCREHIDCLFEIRFSRCSFDGMHVIFRMKTHHAAVFCALLVAVEKFQIYLTCCRGAHY
jgi:hypothetical protein